MSINDFSSVTIAAEGPPVTAVGFGTIGNAAYVPVDILATYTATVTSTTAAGEVLGGLTDSAPYKMVQRCFQQSPRPQRVKILRLETAPVCTYEIVPIAVDGATYTLTVEVERGWDADPDDPLIEHTVSVTPVGTGITANDVCDALATALGSAFDAGDLTSTPDNVTATKLTLTTTGTGRMFWVKDMDPRLIKVTDVTDNANASADLDAVRANDSDWYGLCTAVNSVDYATAAAGWAEAQLVVYATQSSDWAAANDPNSTTDLQPALAALGYKRTIVGSIKANTAGYYGCAAFGERFPFDPGTGPNAGGTFHAKRLAGVPADTWTDTQKTTLKDKGYVLFINTAGVNHTLGGRAASGKPLDQTRFEDWFGTRWQEKFANAELSNGKIPYDTRGLALVEGLCYAQLQEGVGAGGIDPASITVHVPTVAETSSEDRAARNLPNVQMGFRYTGAIEHADVQITVTL